MADMWMDVDVALAEVPVNIMPLIDDTDFKTRETSVAYNAAGMDLVWNFITTAGAFTQTAVTPTSAGDYDWASQGDGMYSIEIPASGGASINNDTEGFGWFTGFCTGVLPWRGPVIGFRAAALNNSLIDAGTTGLLAPTTAARTLDVTATGAAGIDWGNVENPTTALNLSGTNIDVDQIVASVSGAVGSVTGLTASNLDATISSRASAANLATAQTAIDAIKAKTDNLPTDPADQSLIIAATDAITAAIAALNNLSSAQVEAAADAALATVGLTTTITGRIDAAITTRATPAQILTTATTESYAADGAAGTLVQLLYGIQAFLFERVVSGTTVTVNKVDGATPAMTFTLNDATTPTEITRSS